MRGNSPWIFPHSCLRTAWRPVAAWCGYHVRMRITYSAYEAKARFAEVLRHVRDG